MDFEAEKFYWLKHKHENIWRPCYCGQDPHGELWIFNIGIEQSIPISHFNEEQDLWEFKELNQPE